MLPRRSAKQDAESADQVYRYQVREAEKSPVVVMYNIKQNMLLNKQLTFLEKSKKMVVNRITVNQKVMFGAFQRRLNGVKLNHARLQGDIEQQQARRQQVIHGARHGLTVEDEDILRRIWKPKKEPACDNTSLLKPQLNESKSSIISEIHNSIHVSVSSDLNSAHNNLKESHRKVSERRIKPTSAVTPRETDRGEKKIRSKSAVPIIKIVDRDGDDTLMTEMGPLSGRSANVQHLQLSLPQIPSTKNISQIRIGLPDISTSNNVKENSAPKRDTNLKRSKTMYAKPSKQTMYAMPSKQTKDTKTRLNLQGEETELQRSESCTSIVAEVEVQKDPSLLELHRKRMDNSDVMDRINTLLDSMSNLSQDKSAIDRDYYKHSVEARAREGWGRRRRSNSVCLRTGDDERKRASGNPHIANMTVKPLQCNPHIANMTVKPLQCNPHIANMTVKPLQCNPHIANMTVKPPECNAPPKPKLKVHFV